MAVDAELTDLAAVLQHKALALHKESNRADGVAQGSWREFEVVVGEYFRR